MRFYDFLHDIDETSARIAQRDVYLEIDVAVNLTLNTLMRQDVVKYFDEIIAAGKCELSASKRLLFYIVMFGYTVNVRPRPTHSDIIKYAVHLANTLDKTSVISPKKTILCQSPKIKLPRKASNILNSVFKINDMSGLYCLLTADKPSEDSLDALCRDDTRDAALILYSTKSESGLNRKLDRLVFDGPIFTSKNYCLSGVYITSLL